MSRAVFKTVERLLELLVCSIRTAFRHVDFPVQSCRRFYCFGVILTTIAVKLCPGSIQN